MLPTTGSTITPAIRGPLWANAASTGPHVVVAQHERVAAAPSVTPGELGTPSVAAELPAATSRLSTWP